jgi:hypothetical protein
MGVAQERGLVRHITCTRPRRICRRQSRMTAHAMSLSVTTKRNPNTRRLGIAAVRRYVIFCVAGMSLVATAEAQTSGAQPPRLEVAATVSGARPSVAVVTCCELRTPEQYSTTDRTFAAWTAGTKIRLLWGARANTSVEIGLTLPTRRALEVALPSSVPVPIAPGFPATAVVGRTTERRGWTLAVGQGIDLIRQNRWRASLSAEVVFDRVEERYEQMSLVYADPPTVVRFHSTRRETLAAGAGTLGGRFMWCRGHF